MTNLRLICFACVVIGYIFGLFQTAYLYSHARNIDIKKEGSGNAGTTNMFRVMGWKAGLITFLGDIAKLVAAVFLTRIIFLNVLGLPIDMSALTLYTGTGVVLGHNFPCYLKFKGGKGVATSAAIVFCTWDWKYILIGAVIFFGIAFTTKYVSLSSMCMMLSFAIASIIFNTLGITKVAAEWRIDCTIIACFLAALCIFQHRSNIGRIVHGTESRFSFKKEKKEAKENGVVVQEQIAENKAERREFKETKHEAKEKYHEMKHELRVDKKNAKKAYKKVKKSKPYKRKSNN